MADNPLKPKSGPMPPLPSSGTTGRPKAPTQQLPNVKKGSTGKIVVMLSSVAKPAPAGTQAMPRVTGPAASTPTPFTVPPKVVPVSASQLLKQPPPLPPKQVSPAKPLTQLASRVSATTFVKLPPKTANPSFVTLSGKPASPLPITAPTPVAKAKDSPGVPPVPTAKDALAVAPTPAPVSAAAPVTQPKPTTSGNPAPSAASAPEPVAKAAPLPLSTPTAPMPVTKEAPAAATTPRTVPAQIEKPKEALRQVTPPPLPAKKTQKLSRKTGAHLIPPIKLNQLSPQDASGDDSIFAPADISPPVPKPAGWKNLEPGELPLPTGNLKDVDMFERSQRLLPKSGSEIPPVAATPTAPLIPPAVATPQIEAKAPQPPLVAPALKPPTRVQAPAPAPGTAQTLNPPPVPLPGPKPAEPAPVHPVQVAPPLLEKPSEPPPAEKLPQPHLHADAPKTPMPAPAQDKPETAVHKVPALIHPEPTSAKPLPPPQSKTSSLVKSASDWLKKTAPIVLSSSPKPAPMPIAEAKPTLKAPVLPKRLLPKEPDAVETPSVIPPALPPVDKADAKETAKKSDPVVPSIHPPPLPAAASAPLAPLEKESAPDATPPADKSKEAIGTIPPAKIDASAGALSTEVPLAPLASTAAATAAVVAASKGTSPFIAKLPEKDPAKAVPEIVSPPKPPPVTPIAPTPKATLPPTRAERAKRRRFVETLVFWGVIMPLAVAALALVSLHFGRDTRVEGQVIPPAGLSLANEVWIVNDFSTFAAGIAEDLAAERTPLMQEIQERQEHVQRAQADIASREERIRLMQGEIDAAKTEIADVVKKSREDTQHIWDSEGAQIDDEYQSHFNQLKKTIADRAKALNLKYQPDETYQSPEVWANAYRLALYDVPSGVDGAKEHQWLGDQMKLWRDFQKSLDDRKEQLREKAAQLKLAPAPRIADLNNKIEELQQREDATLSEEDPLKAELQQAQSDLTAAQAAEASLDDKYYSELYGLPSGSIFNNIRIPVSANGRFTWIEDSTFVAGEKQHNYWIFSRAIRTDGRQYWSLHRFSISQNQTVELIFEPTGFISTKAILRPNLSPDEQEE